VQNGHVILEVQQKTKRNRKHLKQNYRQIF